MKFAVVSDVHAEQHHDWSTLVFQRLGQRSSELDFVACLGDWTTDIKSSPWDRYLPSLLSHIKCPLLGCIGNHDENPAMWCAYFKLPLDYAMTVKDTRLVFLDSIRWGLVDNKIKWIDDNLSGHEKWKFFFTHLSPRIGHWNYGLDDRRTSDILGVLERRKVTACFTGHMHGFDYLKRSSTSFFICGGGGGDRHDQFPVMHRSNFYLLVECGEDFHVTICQQHRDREQLRPMAEWISETRRPAF
jgi:predicted phosphodiesterase